MPIPIYDVPTPCYILDEDALKKNLTLLARVQDEADCKILLAQKAFSMFDAYPLIGTYLAGTTASSLHEARLGKEEMGGETHICAPAYREDEFDEIAGICDHIVFNSFSQWDRLREKVPPGNGAVSCGIRINPEYSEVETDIYNPCGPYSRLGVTIGNFKPEQLAGIEGLHFHTLCEQGADALAHTLHAVEEKFGKYLYQMKWINLGGGHHITREEYDMELLIRLVRGLKEKYGVNVYLEPGEAVALDAGVLVTEVMDVVRNGMDVAILDTSAACHMPDVLEMPYRPRITGSGEAGEKAHTVRLGGPTCLAGDIIGDYSFDAPLRPGDRLVLEDMAIYSMVKNNTFNGMGLPAICAWSEAGGLRVVREFGYQDFKERLS